MEAIEDLDGVWAALLRACDGTADLDGVHARLVESSVELSRSDIAAGIAALTDEVLEYSFQTPANPPMRTETIWKKVK